VTDTRDRSGCLAAIRRVLGLGAAPQEAERPPYRVRDDFLSPAERNLYGVLRAARRGAHVSRDRRCPSPRAGDGHLAAGDLSSVEAAGLGAEAARPRQQRELEALQAGTRAGRPAGTVIFLHAEWALPMCGKKRQGQGQGEGSEVQRDPTARERQAGFAGVAGCAAKKRLQSTGSLLLPVSSCSQEAERCPV